MSFAKSPSAFLLQSPSLKDWLTSPAQPANPLPGETATGDAPFQQSTTSQAPNLQAISQLAQRIAAAERLTNHLHRLPGLPRLPPGQGFRVGGIEGETLVIIAPSSAAAALLRQHQRSILTLMLPLLLPRQDTPRIAAQNGAKNEFKSQAENQQIVEKNQHVTGIQVIVQSPEPAPPPARPRKRGAPPPASFADCAREWDDSALKRAVMAMSQKKKA